MAVGFRAIACEATNQLETRHGGDLKMAEDQVWSVSIGRWFGVPVRIHASLLLFVALIFGVEWHLRESIEPTFVGTGIVTSLILIGSILIHEFAHLFAIANLGGHCNGMLLTPWGGNSENTLRDGGYSRAIVHMAGPFISGMIFLFGAAVLIRHTNTSLESLVNPLHPHGFRFSNWERTSLEIVTWVNFQLLAVNLLPCFPFDGAAVLRSVIESMQLGVPRHRIESAVMAIGHGLAFTMLGMAWLLRGYDGGEIQPAWFVLLIAGIGLIFTARYSFARETAYDDPDWDELENAEYDSMYEEGDFFHFRETDDDGSYSQWLLEKQHARDAVEQDMEADEERQADEILGKLHRSGITGLTKDEKRILDRFSERLRRRRQSGV
jgi:Zn-dependent protease